MIEEVLKWADVKGVKSMVDVGCGIGGSSRHILNKYPGAPCGLVIGRHKRDVFVQGQA